MDIAMIPFGLLDLTLPSPAENLALDEVLLEYLEEQDRTPILRLWESDRYFVVLGRSSCLNEDVHIDACRRDRIPILRRASGGGTVLQGPGCLSYAIVVPIRLHDDFRDIRLTNRFTLQRIADALARWQPTIEVQGISDLAVMGRKISGSAQRRKRNVLLFHGTILYKMDAQTISRYLKQPKRQPEYRADRPHREFLTTIDAPLEEIKRAIANVWHADGEVKPWPQARMKSAVWNVVERSAFQEAESETLVYNL
jgi:lipoate-protein ligase A